MKTSVRCFLLLLGAITTSSFSRADIPLLTDNVIVAPGTEIWKELSSFYGKWVGNWSAKLYAVLIIEVVGTARDGIDALEKARTLKPDIILMDIQMPHLDGLAATRMLKAEQPDIKIVMLTMSERDEDLFEAIKRGAQGYLLKADETDRFFENLLGFMQEEVPLSPGIAGRVLKEFARKGGTVGTVGPRPTKEEALTPRQMEVLSLVAQGLTYKEVGAELFLTERTIKYHMGQIVEQLQLENRRQVIEYANRMKRDTERA